MFHEHFCGVRYGDIIIYMYNEDMESMAGLLMDSSKHHTEAKLIEYCYMVDCNVLLEYTGKKKSATLTRACSRSFLRRLKAPQDAVMKVKHVV